MKPWTGHQPGTGEAASAVMPATCGQQRERLATVTRVLGCPFCLWGQFPKLGRNRLKKKTFSQRKGPTDFAMYKLEIYQKRKKHNTDFKSRQETGEPFWRMTKGDDPRSLKGWSV